MSGWNNDYAGDLKNIADQVAGLEESYDNLSAELQETENELAEANARIEELEAYVRWAEAYYKNMAEEYAAICAVRGE